MIKTRKVLRERTPKSLDVSFSKKNRFITRHFYRFLSTEVMGEKLRERIKNTQV